MTADQLLDALADLVARRIQSQLAKAPDAWPGLMDVPTAARYLSCTSGRIYKLAARNELPFLQEGEGARLFFPRAALDKWMAERCS